MFENIFSRSPTQKFKSLSESFWRDLNLLPYEQQSAKDSYRAVLNYLHDMIGFPSYYIYLTETANDLLHLEHVDIRVNRAEAQQLFPNQEKIVEILQDPEIVIRMHEKYRNYQFSNEWAGSFLTIPLFGSDRVYHGVILAGPNEQFPITHSFGDDLKNYSLGAASTISRIRNFQSISEKSFTAQTKAKVTRRMLGSTLEINRFITLLLDLALTSSQSEAGFVAMAHEHTLSIRASKNIPQDFLDSVDLSENGIFEWSKDANDPLVLQDFDFIKRFGIKSIVAVPLVEGNNLEGIFALINFKQNQLIESSIYSILKNFCDQIKLVLGNEKLFGQFTEKYIATLISLADAFDVRSFYGEGHSRRVAQTAVMLGQQLILKKDEVDNLHLAGLLHDVGMCGIVESENGFQADFNHPAISASMVEVLPISRDIIEGIRTHHEWWDGWGFPEGVKGEVIPIFGRILAIAEYFEETRNGQLKNKISNREMLIKDITTRRGSQFDPVVVDVFINNIDSFYEKTE